MNPTSFITRLLVSLTLLSGSVLAAPRQFRDRPVGVPKDGELPPGAVDGCWPVYYTRTVTPARTARWHRPAPTTVVEKFVACA
ncbi:hypothetical protein HGRIS_011420 [Hohenbuehelia grisea]|uniref:Uncharacterized protein n=1 Tax=Hohenbuehelia grisea TaxID=104357 RepID=A0ABR3JV35_9AGAR